MGELKRLSLLEETEREAREIEEAIKADPELDDIRVTEEMDAALFAKIQAFEQENKKNSENREKDEDDNSSGKTYLYRKKSRKGYFIIGLAAVLVLVLGTGLVGVGNKAYWKEKTEQELEYGTERQQIIKVEDMDDIHSKEGEESTAYDQIEKELGFSIVRPRYIPKLAELSQIEILEEIQQARVFYKYKGEIIRYTMYLNSSDSSWAEKIEDKKIGEYSVLVITEAGTDIEIIVDEYQVEGYDESRRIVNFEYKGIHYQIKGIMKKEEFDKILENLRFF
ncbi:MAG: DUF4367 domain-containing protein [Ruminococcus sp.]|nr:DUF4367 domain-containing protein [Ruminococcus sp.]